MSDAESLFVDVGGMLNELPAFKNRGMSTHGVPIALLPSLNEPGAAADLSELVTLMWSLPDVVASQIELAARAAQATVEDAVVADDVHPVRGAIP